MPRASIARLEAAVGLLIIFAIAAGAAVLGFESFRLIFTAAFGD